MLYLNYKTGLEVSVLKLLIDWPSSTMIPSYASASERSMKVLFKMMGLIFCIAPYHQRAIKILFILIICATAKCV